MDLEEIYIYEKKKRMNGLREFYYFSTFNKCGREEEALPGYIYTMFFARRFLPKMEYMGGQVGGVGPWNSIKEISCWANKV